MTLDEHTAPEASQVVAPQAAQQETPVAENQPEVGEHDETEVEVAASTPETQNGTDQREDGQLQHEEARRPTRAERRLHRLFGGSRSDVNPLTELMNALPTPEPDEYGNYTPEQVQQIAAAEASRTLQLDRDVQEYRKETESYAQDIEDVGVQIETDFKDNPKLAEVVNQLLVQQLQAANMRTDANGNQVFVPVQKASQLYSQLKDALKLMSEQGKQHATAALAKQVAEGAVTPGASQETEPRSLEQLQSEMWNNPGKVAAEMRARLAGRTG